MKRLVRGGIVAVVVVLAACGSEPAEAPFTVRDSAGIAIVENRGPSWGEGEGWTVEPEPLLAVGTLDGPDETQFFQLSDVGIRGDGTVLVLDQGDARVRAFSPDGTFLWGQGRQGEGPGEYGRPSTLLLLPGDSLLVYDGGNRRVTILTPEGELARTYRPEPPEGASQNAPMALVEPGLLLSTAGVTFSTGEETGTDGRVERRPPRLLVSDLEGTAVRELGEYPGSEFWMVASDRFVSITNFPFGKGGEVDGAAGVVVSGATETAVWEFQDVQGTLVRSVRLAVTAPPVTPADWDRAVEARIPEDAGPDVRSGILATFEAIPVPESQPVFSDLLLDDRGHLWVERYSPPWAEDDPRSWWVFDPEGRLLGEVEIPAGLQVDRIRGDRVLGRWRDELEIQQVRVHRIVGRD